MEQTLVLIKPDAMYKNLAGNIINDLYSTGLELVGIKLVAVSKELAEKHYEEHKNKPFFEQLVRHIIGEFHTKKVLAMVWQGENAIQKIRDIAGNTNPHQAVPTTIRGKYGRIHLITNVFENVIHSSDSVSSAEKEIKLWFSPNELLHTIYKTKKVECKECKRIMSIWS